MHLPAEAEDRINFARAMPRLLLCVAVALHKLGQRRCGVFADRYHSRALTRPRAVRNARCYALANGKKHAAECREVLVPDAIDLFSSAPWFGGFREVNTVRNLPAEPPVVPPRIWLLSVGWRRHGLLSVHELPASG